MTVSYIEIYNEKIWDLLKSDNKKYLCLRESSSKGVTLVGASKI